MLLVYSMFCLLHQSVRSRAVEEAQVDYPITLPIFIGQPFPHLNLQPVGSQVPGVTLDSIQATAERHIETTRAYQPRIFVT